MKIANDVEKLYERRADKRWDRVCVGDMAERMTWSSPDSIAIVGWDGAYSAPQFASLTWRQVDQLANKIANMLLKNNLKRGDRLLMLCENSVEAYVTKLGAAKIGVVPAALNPSLANDVIRHLATMLKPGYVIADGGIRAELIVALSEIGSPVNTTIKIDGDVIPGTDNFADLVEQFEATEPTATVHGDDIWELLFTSGTTAMPKAVMLSHVYAYLASHGMALTMTRGLHRESDLCLVSFLPIIYHVGDQLLSMPALVTGGKLIIGRRHNPRLVAEAVVKYGATAVWGGAPQSIKQISLELEALKQNQATLTVMIYGWGAVEPDVLKRLEQLAKPGFQLVGIFGQTEAIACHRFWPVAERSLFESAGSAKNYVGRPSPLLASTVTDDTGKDFIADARYNEPGEAVYRSPVMMAGYYLDPEATAKAFDGGWFHSGDSCAISEDGTRVMIDRYKDIIKSGGENVSSMRVEARLHAHPGVTKAAVVGLAHPRWDEAVTAFVVKADPYLDEQTLINWAREGLARFETPKKIVFVEVLPETVGGKVLKHRLRGSWAELYRDSN